MTKTTRARVGRVRITVCDPRALSSQERDGRDREGVDLEVLDERGDVVATAPMTWEAVHALACALAGFWRMNIHYNEEEE